MKKIKVGKLELKKNGFIFDFYQQEIEMNGKIQQFDYIKHNGAVGVLLIDKEDFILVEQFRYPLQKEIIEIVAGKVEKDEINHEISAIREVREELGIEVKNLQLIDTIMPSGGIYSEKIDIYVAEVKSFDLQTCFDDFEEVKMIRMNKQEAIEAIKTNKIVDTKTVFAIMRYINDRKND